jgi:peptide/nickel transport system permease protein
MTTAEGHLEIPAETTSRSPHPVRSMVVRRLLFGVGTLFFIAVIVYFATTVLPGDAATAILGKSATPARLAKVRAELGLDQPVVERFWHWISNAATGDFGYSLGTAAPVGSRGQETHEAVTGLVDNRLWNSAVLIGVTAVVSTLLGISPASTRPFVATASSTPSARSRHWSPAPCPNSWSRSSS